MAVPPKGTVRFPFVPWVCCVKASRHRLCLTSENTKPSSVEYMLTRPSTENRGAEYDSGNSQFPGGGLARFHGSRLRIPRPCAFLVACTQKSDSPSGEKVGPETAPAHSTKDRSGRPCARSHKQILFS